MSSRLVCMSLFLTITIALNAVDSIDLIVQNSVVNKPVYFTLWFNSTIYQFTLPKGTVGSYSSTDLAIIDSPNCPKTEAHMMIENHIDIIDALVLDKVSFHTSAGTWYGINGRCIDDTLSSFQPWLIDPTKNAAWIADYTGCSDGVSNTGICIDGQIDECEPYKQMLYFDLSRPNEYIMDAEWSDATNVSIDNVTCDPTYYPTFSPSSSPTSSPTNYPTFNPSSSPTHPPSTDPTFVPSSSPTHRIVDPFDASAMIPSLFLSNTSYFESINTSNHRTTDIINMNNKGTNVKIWIILGICALGLGVVVLSCIIFYVWLKTQSVKQKQIEQELQRNPQTMVRVEPIKKKEIMNIKEETRGGNNVKVMTAGIELNSDEFVVGSDSESDDVNGVSTKKGFVGNVNIEGEIERRGTNELNEGCRGKSNMNDMIPSTTKGADTQCD